jgi:hypothetical protein
MPKHLTLIAAVVAILALAGCAWLWQQAEAARAERDALQQRLQAAHARLSVAQGDLRALVDTARNPDRHGGLPGLQALAQAVAGRLDGPVIGPPASP